MSLTAAISEGCKRAFSADTLPSGRKAVDVYFRFEQIQDGGRRHLGKI